MKTQPANIEVESTGAFKQTKNNSDLLLFWPNDINNILLNFLLPLITAFRQIYEYTRTIDHFSDKQSGFRFHCSTTTLLANLVDNCIVSLDKNEVRYLWIIQRRFICLIVL